MDWEIPEPEPEPNPESLTAGVWYFAIVCAHCEDCFEPGDVPALQTLDPDQFPLRLTCPYCKTSALYQVKHLLPMWREAPS